MVLPRCAVASAASRRVLKPLRLARPVSWSMGSGEAEHHLGRGPSGDVGIGANYTAIRKWGGVDFHHGAIRPSPLVSRLFAEQQRRIERGVLAISEFATASLEFDHIGRGRVKGHHLGG